MWGDHLLQQLQPRQWAARILDSARAGDAVDGWSVNRALQITGDLPKSFNLSSLHHEKPFSPSDSD